MSARKLFARLVLVLAVPLLGPSCSDDPDDAMLDEPLGPGRFDARGGTARGGDDALGDDPIITGTPSIDDVRIPTGGDDVGPPIDDDSIRGDPDAGPVRGGADAGVDDGGPSGDEPPGGDEDDPDGFEQEPEADAGPPAVP